MATLGNERKLAAVSRETHESTRNSRRQNTRDPESTQDYISQVSEEIEGRVTKKLSKELSRTESRILGALLKLDEFLLSPQVRTCSVAVPGTSRNNNSENRETTGDRSSDSPCPEVGYFSHHSGHLNSPETKQPSQFPLRGACSNRTMLQQDMKVCNFSPLNAGLPSMFQSDSRSYQSNRQPSIRTVVLSTLFANCQKEQNPKE